MDGISIREYVERIFDEHEKAYNAQRLDAEKHLNATAEALNSRLEGMNEFRHQIERERVSYATIDGMKNIEKRLEKLESLHSWQLGFGAAVLLLAGIIAGIIGTFLKFF
jgi:hypothetical protein